MSNQPRRKLVLALMAGGMLAACTPTVQLQAPEKPIEINLNVNIEHRVKVEIEKDVRDSISKNKDIF
ncbi:MAG TPA: YnbE family lipoprotein [Micavibrio sp.]